MLILEAAKAYENLKNGIFDRTFRVPSKQEPGYTNGCLLPKVKPKFWLAEKEKIFTIGSCFAREIEGELVSNGFDIPVSRFTIHPGELPYAAPHLLNEYNAGTLLQRLESVFDHFAYQEDMGIEETPEGYIDLFLHIHGAPVTKERLLERRKQIDTLYKEIKSSSALIITLGLVECWYDSALKCYVNKAPSVQLALREPGRYYFHRMDVENVFARLSRAIELINQSGEKKILVTVSPVPLEATFTGNNAIMANSYSKSVLRIVAENLKEKFDNVDYFPSFEIAISGGLTHYAADNIHLQHHLAKMTTDHMLDNYYFSRNEDQGQSAFSPHYVDLEYRA